MNKVKQAFGKLAIGCLAMILLSANQSAVAQDLLGDTIGFSGATLNLQRYIDPGSDNRIISMTAQPTNTGSQDLFVSTRGGSVFAVNNNQGVVTSTEWFNYNAAVATSVTNASNGFTLDSPGNVHGGLRAVAFHPEFATNGKFYTSAMVDRPSGISGINYIGTSNSGFDSESAVAEWTFDHNLGQVDNSSYRELLRVQMPVFDHPIKQLGFNNFAQPGDEDYGLLYITHGDGSQQSATAGGGQVRLNGLGKVLRINPLADGSNPYTTPNNPFVGDPTTLDEIYTLGHRNPHHISFAQASDGSSVPIISEAGRDNIEEVNLLQAGGDYGWSDREGTFVHNNNGGPNGGGYGLDYGVSNLPVNEWQLNDYVYPAAQYDHDEGDNLGVGFVGSAIAGGFVIQNNSDPALQNQYIFADFGKKSGNVYQADFNDLLAAHTQLADGELPSQLTQAPISRLQLTLDADGNGTIDTTADNLNSLLGVERNDVRFGRGPNGEMFISSVQTGLVYLVTNSVRPFGTLRLVVDADTGETKITNNGGTDVNLIGYSIASASGTLDQTNWQSLSANPNFTGWELANPTQNALSELNPSSSTTVGSAAIPLGSPVDLADAPAFGTPAGVPGFLNFEYSTEAGEVLSGVVELTGSLAVNNLLLTVDSTTGQATLTNQSQTTIHLNGYSINSESGSLKSADGSWTSLADQSIAGFEEANGTATSLSELALNSSDGLTLAGGEVLLLGDLFSTVGEGGVEDLSLEFIYEEVNAAEGDYNNDGTVDAADYTVWRDALGSNTLLPNEGAGVTVGMVTAEDYEVWRTNYGSTGGLVEGLILLDGIVQYVAASSANLSSTAVPEPSSWLLTALTLSLWSFTRVSRHRQRA